MNGKKLKGKKLNIKKDIVKEKNKVEVKSSNMTSKKYESKSKNDSTNLIIALIIMIILFLLGLVFTICYVNYALGLNGNTTTTSNGKNTKTTNVTITEGGLADAVEKVYDAVVIVKNYNKGQLYATGTGFVYDTDDEYAYILTNHHVVSNASSVSVIFTNNKEEQVEIVGSDEFIDIAVLKIAKDKIISVAEMGTSEGLRVGDTTFAVGSPINSDLYSWTVTRGILSGKDRIVEVEGSSNSSSIVIKVLQTDTAINSGNSGGPLCDVNGNVIGITNMKLVTESVEGMGFAIPIETALNYAEKLVSGESMTKPYLGISMYDGANSYYSNGEGVYVAAVEEDGPADKAGIKKGDIITAIDGVEVSSGAYLRYELYKHEVGEEIVITLTRSGKTKKVTITLGESK